MSEEKSLEWKVLNWLANGKTGVSSKCMAYTACGVEPKDNWTPSDPADLNRCLLLLEQVPEIRAHFPAIREVSERWSWIIDAWDELEASFIDEVGRNWSKSDSAPKTYALMKRILQEDSTPGFRVRL